MIFLNKSKAAPKVLLPVIGSGLVVDPIIQAIGRPNVRIWSGVLLERSWYLGRVCAKPMVIANTLIGRSLTQGFYQCQSLRLEIEPCTIIGFQNPGLIQNIQTNPQININVLRLHVRASRCKCIRGKIAKTLKKLVLKHLLHPY